MRAFQFFVGFIFLLVLSSNSSFAQLAEDPASTRYWDANANLFAKKIQARNDLGYAVCGEGVFWSGGTQYNGAFVVSADSSGDQHWEKCFTTFFTDFSFETVVQWPDSSFLAAGKILNPMTNIHGAALIKLDKDGNEIWKGSVENGSDYLTEIRNVLITSDTTALLLGARDVAGEPSFVMMINSSGTKLWSSDLHDPSGERIRLEGVVRLDNNDFLIAGGISEGIYWKGLLLRMTSDGQLVWSKKFDQQNSFFSDALSDGTNVYLRDLNNSDLINGVVKCDTSGNVNWIQNANVGDMYTWGNEGRRTLTFDADSSIVFYYQDPYSSTYIKLAADGSVVSAISEMGRSDGFTSYSDSSVAFLVNGPSFGVKKSAALSLEHFAVTHLPVWQGQGSNCIWVNNFLLNPIIGNSFSAYPLVTGDSYQIVPAMMELATWYPTIDHYCVDFLGGIEEQEEPAISLYPNPVEDALHVSCEEGAAGGAIRNTCGAIVRTFQPSANLILDLSTLAPGLYFVQIGSKTRSFVKK
jgi:hypothetical protein